MMPTGDGFARHDNALDDIDADIAAACGHRTVMLRKLAARDDDNNRAAVDVATQHVDDLLELRHAMQQAERMVSQE
jgi:hypothetical protein